jgi:membrane protein YqaA with SNARE-associated domain
VVILWLSMFGLSIASALLPFLPIEAFIIGGAAAMPGTAAAVSLGIAAGAGATVGKVIWYEAARRGVQSDWAQKKLAGSKIQPFYDRWSARMEGRPVFSGLLMLVSAFVGIPPLLAMAAVAGLLRVPMWVFLPTVFLGRSLRFGLLFLGADVALH